MSKLSIVIPAWNEEGAIAEVIERVLSTRDALQAETEISQLEIIVVDDGSTDSTGDIVTRAAATARDRRATVHLIRHQANRGYGAALQDGFQRARGQLLAFLDADCTYPPQELPGLCSALLAEPRAAFVVGNRMGSGVSQMPALRRLGNVFFAALASLLAGKRIADCSSGMRVLRRSALGELGELPAGLDFTPAMTMRAQLKGLMVLEVPIAYYERVGRSKLKVARDGWRFLCTILREAWAQNPARLLGVVTSITAVSVLGLLAGAAGLTGAWVQLGLAGMIVVLVGVVVMMAGLLLAHRGASVGMQRATSDLALPHPAQIAGELMDEKRSASRDGYSAVGETEPVAARSR